MIYKCEICGKEFDTISGAQACEKACQEEALAGGDYEDFDCDGENEDEDEEAEEIENRIESCVNCANSLYVEADHYKSQINELTDKYYNCLNERRKQIDKIRSYITDYKNLVPNCGVKYSNSLGQISVDIKPVSKEEVPVTKECFPLVEIFKDIFRGI